MLLLVLYLVAILSCFCPCTGPEDLTRMASETTGADDYILTRDYHASVRFAAFDGEVNDCGPLRHG